MARHFVEAGWRVHVLLGWSGASAVAVAAECRAIGITVGHVPPLLNFGDHQAAAAAAASNAPAASPRGEHLPKFVQDLLRVPRRLVEGVRAYRRAGLAKRYAGKILDGTAPDAGLDRRDLVDLPDRDRGKAPTGDGCDRSAGSAPRSARGPPRDRRVHVDLQQVAPRGARRACPSRPQCNGRRYRSRGSSAWACEGPRRSPEGGLHVRPEALGGLGGARSPPSA